MKSKLIYISLIILPATLFVFEIIVRQSRGEYYLFAGYDGIYGYLLSSLNIAQLKAPGFAQHPGIVTQFVQAFVIKLSHLLWGIDSDIVLDTVNRPEFYLAQINFAFTYLTIFALFILGIVSYRKTGNIFAAIFIQFTPFVSVLIIYQLTQNTVETTILVFILIMLSVAISFIYEKNMTNQKNIRYVFVFGIVCGLALASKISFLPIMIIPFLLIKKFIHKGLFVLISFVLFSILFFSISPDTSKFFNFVFRSIGNSGWYGSGPSNVIETSQIVPTLKFILSKFFMFFIVYILMVITILFSLFPHLRLR